MIHLLGVGSIGSLVASNLATGRIPVSLILRSAEDLQKYKQAGETIIIRSRGSTYETHLPATSIQEVGPIDKLIVTTKAHQTLNALNSVRSKLSPSSSILFIQNGMGIDRTLKKEIWPDLASQPTFLQGLTSTGVKRTHSRWSFIQHGAEPFILSEPEELTPSSRELLDAFTKSNSMVMSNVLSQQDFLIKQYEKLVVNSVINPLTAIIGCENGRLAALSKFGMLRNITFESCKIIQRYIREKHPDYANAVEGAINPDRMLRIVLDVCHKTSKNTSSMLSDIENGRATEINYINGYLCNLASDIGVGCPYNRSMAAMVNMREQQSSWELDNNYIPLEMDQ